nr:unnamed protein product [Callosobruchus analis]
MYYPDLEWFLTLANFLGVNPEKKGSVVQMVLYMTVLCCCLSIPGLTIVMLSLMDHVGIRDVLGYLSNFTMFIHLSTLYFKRSQVLDLFERTQYRFWNIKDYDEMVKSTKWIRNMHASFMIFYTVTAMIKPHMNEYLPRMAVLLYEDFVIVAAISVFVAFDLLVRTFLVLAEAQFRMLNQEFLLIYDEHELDRGLLYQRMRKCVKHHSFLIDFFHSSFINRFSDIFSTSLLLFVGNITLSLCICMYAMLQDHWQNHLTSAKDLLTALSGCQKQFEVKAGGLIRVDMEMFLASCKTMVSYCMFLQTIMMYYVDLMWCVNLGNFLGVHPEKQNSILQKLQYTFILVFSLTISFLTILLLYYKKGPVTVKDLAAVSPNFTLFFHALMKLSTLFFRRKQVFDILQLTNTHFWEVDRDSGSINVTLKKTTRLRIFYVTSVYLFALSSVVKPHINGGMTFKCYKPQWLPRYVLLAFEDIISLAINSVFCCFDVLMMTLLTLTQVQFRMLNEKIYKIYNLNSPENVRTNMRECINHYNVLIDFTSRFKQAFSITLLLFVGNISISLCICIPPLHVVIEAFLHLVAGLNMIYICYSAPAQALMNEANRVGRSIYFSRWYQFPSDSKDVLTFLIGTQKKYEISAVAENNCVLLHVPEDH